VAAAEKPVTSGGGDEDLEEITPEILAAWLLARRELVKDQGAAPWLVRSSANSRVR